MRLMVPAFRQPRRVCKHLRNEVSWFRWREGPATKKGMMSVFVGVATLIALALVLMAIVRFAIRSPERVYPDHLCLDNHFLRVTRKGGAEEVWSCRVCRNTWTATAFSFGRNVVGAVTGTVW